MRDVTPTPDAAPSGARGFLQGASIYMAASVLQAAIPLATLPIVARKLSVAEFGNVEVVAISNSIVGVLCSAPAVASFNYFFHKQGAREVSGRAMVTWYLGPGLLLTLISACALMFFMDWGALPIRWPILLLGSAALFSATQVIGAMTNVLRVSERPARCALFLLSSAAINSGTATACCLLASDHRLEGYLAGLTGASVLMACSGVIMARPALWGPGVDHVPSLFTQWKRMITFGYPLLPAVLAEASLAFVDRILVVRLSGTEALGEYGIGARVAGVTSLAIQGLVLALLPYTLRTIHTKSRRKASIALGTTWQWHSFVCTSVACLLATAAPELVTLVGGDTYRQAACVVPWLALAIGLKSFTHFSYLGTLKVERTHFFSLAVLLGVVVICVTPLAVRELVPTTEGNLAVAIGHYSGTLVVVALSLCFSQRLYALKWPLRRLIAQCTVATIFAGLVSHLEHIEARLLALGLVSIVLLAATVTRGDTALIKALLMQRKVGSR